MESPHLILKPLVGSNQETETEKVPPSILKPLIGSNQKTETEKLPPSMLKPLVGSNQNIEMEELPLQLRDRPRFSQTALRPFRSGDTPHNITFGAALHRLPQRLHLSGARCRFLVNTGGSSTTFPLTFSKAPDYTGNSASPF